MNESIKRLNVLPVLVYVACEMVSLPRWNIDACPLGQKCLSVLRRERSFFCKLCYRLASQKSRF